MPLRLNDRDVVPPGVASVRLGNVDIVAKPPRPVPVAWVAHTSTVFEQYGVLHFANDTPHDGGSIVTRYELTAAGETAAIAGVGFDNSGRVANLSRSLECGNIAAFPFTASTATFTVTSINAFGESEPSDSFTLAGLPGGTAAQELSSISISLVVVALE
jgi:hypothetical protein